VSSVAPSLSSPLQVIVRRLGASATSPEATASAEVVGGGARLAEGHLAGHVFAFAFERDRFALSLNVPRSTWTTIPSGLFDSAYNTE
jgi:hypothetical protein